jgi:Domain of unknown function (DUF4411)
VSRQPGLFRKYVLDSCFFIDLYAHDGSHPRDRYVGLWAHFEAQVNRGEIIAPMEVREELDRSVDEELDRWLTRHRSMFVEVSTPQIVVLQQIVRAYPAFTQGRENMADPAVVSLAAAEQLTVLTSERYQHTPSPTFPKIPNLCELHRISCMGINDYLRAEGVVLR